MSKTIKTKLISNKRYNFYFYLRVYGKSKRLRKKASKIVDCCLTDGDIDCIIEELNNDYSFCYKCNTYYAECGCK